MRRAVVFWADWGWIFGVFFLLMAIAPSLVTEAQVQATEQRSKSESRELNARLQQQEQERVALIERSKERAKNGCQTLVLNGQAALIRSGMRGRDGVTGHPLQAGICVTDALGSTAITDAEGFLVDVLPGPGMASGELRGALPEPENKEVDLNGFY
jgi:hypothetical protein